MDNQIVHNGDNISKMDRYIEFIRFFKSNDKYNILVTLNQDLLVERAFLRDGEKKQNQGNKPLDCVQLYFPYSSFSFDTVLKSIKNYNGYIQPVQQYLFENFEQVTKYENNGLGSGVINYLKIHGSSNWENSEGNDMIICGHNKESMIKKNKILKNTFEMFEHICGIEKIKIVAVGYGFGDDHVNRCIKNAISNQGKLFIIDEKPPQESNAVLKKIDFDKYIHCCFFDFMSDKFRDKRKEMQSWINKN